MKKIVSLLMVSLVIVGAVGFFPVSSAYAAGNAEEVEAEPVLIIEAKAEEVSHVEISEAIEVPEEEETVEVSEVPEVTECPEVSESSDPEVNVVMCDIGSYVEFVDYDAIIFSVDELFFQVWEMDADAEAKVVQYGDEYYFVVEWNMLESNGFVQLTKESFEDEEFFICGGDEFRAMIIRSFMAGESMFEA